MPGFPLILAANRDEDYDRPTLHAAFWGDAPDVLGGRDALQLGSWLAITRSGRFAAVTNLRRSLRDPLKRSRGELVSDFVCGTASPMIFMRNVRQRVHEYAGFHLIVGIVGGDVIEGGVRPPHAIDDIFALSNAAVGERWPKVEVAEDEMRRLAGIGDEDELIDAALKFLLKRNGTNRPQDEIFVASDVHGTRSSTVIVAGRDHVTFVEQSFGRGGVPEPGRRRFRFAISVA